MQERGGTIEGVPMGEEPGHLRMRAEACRRLADIADDEANKALWLKRADHWEEMAAKAEKEILTRPMRP
jgi:hypothetical protein